MRTTLCIVHRSDPELRAVAKAVRDVRATGGQLVLMSICDAREEELLSHQLSDRSFVGLRQTEEVANLSCCLAEEETQDLLKKAESYCRERECAFSSGGGSGGLMELVHDFVSEHQPAQLFLPKLPQGLFSRLLRGDRTEAIVRTISCPVTVC